MQTAAADRSTAFRLNVWLLVVLQLFWMPLAGCKDEFSSSSSGSSSAASGARGLNVGELVFQVVRGFVARDPDNTQAKLDAIDQRRQPFVDAINLMVPSDVSQGAFQTITSIFPMVDDGTIPGMTDSIADIIQELVDEPGHVTLAAIQELLSSTSKVSLGDAIDLLGRSLRFPEIEAVLTASAELIRENDGVDDNGQPNHERDLVGELLRLGSTKLATITLPQGQGSLLGDELLDVLLDDSGYRGHAQLGPAAWVVRLDPHGNPEVAIDPATGFVYTPFIDDDGDGYADVDGQGRPVDALHQPLDILAFGTDGARDADGRALAASGAPLYTYVNVKHAPLGYVLALVGAAIDRGVVPHGLSVLEGALGARTTRTAGTPDPSDDFEGYRDDSLVRDVFYGVGQLAKDATAPELLEAAAALLNSNPQQAEQLFLLLGRALEEFRTVQINKHDARALVDQLLPVLDETFEVNNTTGQSTARLLMEVLNTLGQTARDLPQELAILLEYRKVERNNQAAWLPVDFSQGPWVNGVDNRSLLAQLLSLLYNASQCNLPILGNLAELSLSTMSTLSPATVDSLVQLVMALPGVANFVCPGVGNDLQSLEGLATSGALDALLPITKVFADQQEIPTLVRILQVLHLNAPALRAIEPTLAALLNTGGGAYLMDLVAQTATTPIPGTNRVVADAMADGIARFIDDDSGGALRRNGTRAATQVHLLLEPVRLIEDQLETQGRYTDWTEFLNGVGDLVIQRVTNDNGTPTDPSDDFEQLQQQSLVPLLERVLQVAVDAMPADPAQRAADIDGWLAELDAVILGHELPLMMDVVDIIFSSSAAEELEAAIANLLTPRQQAQDDVFGALLRLVGAGAQLQADTASLETVLRFLGRVLDPSTRHVVVLLDGFEQLVRRDAGQTLLAIARNALDRTLSGTNEAPVEVVVEFFQALWEMENGNVSVDQLSLAELDTLLRTVITFLRDDPDGLASVYDMIRNRS